MSLCCPPNAEKYMPASAVPPAEGTFTILASGLELYCAGDASSTKKGVLLLPDIWGWNSGRIRNVADMFASVGYFAVIPKLMVPCLEGGTDGDALYPSFDLSNADDMAKFGPYFSQFDWDVMGPKITETTEYLKAQGMEKLAVYGFCWYVLCTCGINYSCWTLESSILYFATIGYVGAAGRCLRCWVGSWRRRTSVA